MEQEHEEKIEEEIPGEETSEREETVEPKGEKKEAEGRVIEIHAPPPFDEEALNPFIDLFMAKRGLGDRKQAAVKLANVLSRMGYDPRRDIRNVTAYVENLSTVLGSVPDTAETLPVKGALMARGAVQTVGMLSRSHFGERSMNGVDPELQKMLKFAQNAKVTMKILDSAFAGDSSSGGSSEMKEMKARVDRLEGDKALDVKLAPLHTEMRNLQTSVQALLTRDSTKKPAAEDSPAMQKVTALMNAMDKRLDGIDQRYQFSTEVQGIRTEIATLKTLVEAGGGKGGDATTVFDQAVSLMDKIAEVTKKYGGAGFGEGDFDWRVAALSTVSEIGTEAITAAKEIYAERPTAEMRADKTSTTEKISERVVDRRLLSYIQQKTAAGILQFNSLDAAKKIGVSNDEILVSYQRLVQKGILKSGGAGETKSEEKQPTEEEQWVEG